MNSVSLLYIYIDLGIDFSEIKLIYRRGEREGKRKKKEREGTNE